MLNIKTAIIGSRKGAALAVLGPRAPFIDTHGLLDIPERGIIINQGPDFPDSQIMTAGRMKLMLDSIERMTPPILIMTNPLPAIEVQGNKSKANYPPFIDTAPGAFKKKNQRQKRKRSKW